MLPAQAPIRDFVHHNTLHGFQHLPFTEALRAARAITGNSGYLSAAAFRQYYRQGRIQQADLDAVLQADPGLDAEQVLFQQDERPITRREIYRISLTCGLMAVTASQFVWQVEENHALEQFQADVPASARVQLLALAQSHAQPDEVSAIADLWQACMQQLDLQHYLLHAEQLAGFTPEQASRLFATEVNADEDQHSERQVQQHARKLLDELMAQVGQRLTLRGLLQSLVGTDIMDDIRPLLLRSLSLWLDQGLAGWHQQPAQSVQQGFYARWKQSALLDWGSLLQGLNDWQEHLNSLPDEAEACIEAELRRMGIPEEDWMDYLERLALELPGWSGMFLWRQQHPGYAGLSQPVDLLDYLAVRLVLEHAFARSLCRQLWQMDASLPALRGRFRRHTAEFMVRHYTFAHSLPEYLLNQARQMLARSRPGVYEDADWLRLAHLIWTWSHSPLVNPEHGLQPYNHGWRLFRLMQHLGLDGASLREIPRKTLMQMLECAQLDGEHSSALWLQAFERHYREQVFMALVNNHRRGTWAERAPQRPAAQVIFCMDDREEGIRRHLEEINPAIETLGAAAFFNIPMNWHGLDDPAASKLCPVPVTPVHEVREQSAAPPEQQALHVKRRGQRLHLREILHQFTRQRLISGTVASLLAAPGALALLLGKTFAPLPCGTVTHRWQEQFDQPPLTRVQFSAEQIDQSRSARHNQQGFTDQEQARLVGDFLQAHGLNDGFAPLVVMMGHYSTNQNNPHQAAYGCGACSGRYSGPNARVFAAMANRPAIRDLLRARHIHIPEDCWFVGAEHDTCSEAIRWTDLDLIPPSLHTAFASLQAELAQAAKRSAHERCRKLMSAPPNPTLEQALAHVAGRAVDYSQARPELGHATNAVALIGRRHLSQGAFFDRRAFLISYDYRTDPDGTLLENILLTAGPVGAGISLEYYFSTVDNTHYGSGSKITHNVTGLLGVMEGACSDLRTGLPQQMIEIHEPMRLLIVLESSVAVVEAIYARQPVLQELIGNGWVTVAVKHPETASIHLFQPDRGFVAWESPVVPLPEVACSADWYQGQHHHLPPALIKGDTHV
ncbi:MAG: DUF2309 domain-containing protein [Thiolinea sp.]